MFVSTWLPACKTPKLDTCLPMNFIQKTKPAPTLFIAIATFLVFSYPNLLKAQPHAQAAEIMLNKAKNLIPADNAQAALLLNKSATTFQKEKNWEKYVECLTNLGTAYYYLQAFDSFETTVRLAHSLAEKHLPKSSPNYLTAVSEMGLVYDNEGNLQKAIQFYRAAIALNKNTVNDKYLLYVDYANLSYTYLTLGDYDESIMCWKKCYDVIADTMGTSNHEIGGLLPQIARCYKAKNQLDVARDYYLSSLATLDKLDRIQFYDQTRWFAYLGISEIYLEQKDTRNAFLYAQKAQALNAKYNLLEDFRTWALLGNLYLSTGKYQLALDNFEKQRKSAEAEYSMFRNHPQTALATSNIAKVYAETHDYPLALKHYQIALQTIAVGFSSNDTRKNPAISQFVNKSDALVILAGKADALAKYHFSQKKGTANLEAANECYLLIADLIQSIRQGYLAEGSKHTLSERALPLYEKAIGVALEMYRATGKELYLEQAFAFAEGNKAVLLFENIRDQLAKGFAGIPDSLLAKERDLLAKITFYEKIILESQQKATPDAPEKLREWNSKLFGLKEQRKQLNELLEKQYPSYFERKYSDGPASIAAIRQRLPDGNTALVEYLLGPQNGYVFFLTKKDLRVLTIKDVTAVEAHRLALRQLIAAPPSSERFASDFAAFAEHAHTLYTMLLKDGLTQAGQGIERLLIVPDGPLNFLPFELLLRQPATAGSPDFSPKKLHYLFEDYAIGYHYSATLLANATPGQAGGTAFLGYAPSFGQGVAGSSSSSSRACVGGQLSDLVCNGQEVEAIRQLLGGQAVLSNGASTQAFLRDAPNCGILHLATHACIDETAPGLNKIFFADGHLSQLDLDQLRLHAVLTVLSACNTGTGKLQQGEGVMSMARSFLLAGSASVLTSLWAVDDCATSDIMLRYYQFLKSGETKDRAIQQSKLAFLATADRERSHPYYWAPFVQIGDTAPIMRTGFFAGKMLYLLAGVAGALAVFLYLRRRAKR